MQRCRREQHSFPLSWSIVSSLSFHAVLLQVETFDIGARVVCEASYDGTERAFITLLLPACAL